MNELLEPDLTTSAHLFSGDGFTYENRVCGIAQFFSALTLNFSRAE